MREESKQRLGWLLFVISLAFLLGYFGKGHLSFAALQAKSISMKASVAAHYGQSVVLYILIYVVIIALALPLIIPYALLGGFLFGIWQGTLYSLIGVFIGMMGAYFFVQYLLVDMVKERFADRLEVFKVSMQQYGANYMLLLYWSAVVPSFVIVSLAVAAEIPLTMYAWTAVVGNAPLLFICSMAGRQLGQLEGVSQIFSPQIIVLLGLLVLLALFPIIMKRFHRFMEKVDKR